MNEAHRDGESAAAAIDEIARGVLDTLSVGFALAGTDAERDAAFRLRHDVAVQAGWIRPDAYLDGREWDEYDDDAVHIVGSQDGSIVATARLVFRADSRPLPMEVLFGFDVEPVGEVVELGRQSVDLSHRRSDHLVFYGLLAKAWIEARARGFRVLGGLASARMLQRYREMNFDMMVLGPSKMHWGEDRFPIRFDPAGNRESLRAVYEGLTGATEYSDAAR